MSLVSKISVLCGLLALGFASHARAARLVNDGVWSFGDSQFITAIGLADVQPGAIISYTTLNEYVASGSAFGGGTVYEGFAGLTGAPGWVSGLTGSLPWTLFESGSQITVQAADIDRVSDDRVFAAFFYVWDGSTFVIRNPNGGTGTFTGSQSRGSFPLTKQVPDAGASVALLALGLVGLCAARRTFSR